MSSIAVITKPPQETTVPIDKLPIDDRTTNPDEEQYRDVWQQELKQNWSGGYVQMPNAVSDDPSLSPKAKLVYGRLIAHMWFDKDHCWPGQKELSKKMGCCRRTIIRALQELYDRGYIEVERRGLGATNRYFLNPLSFAHSFRPISGPRTAYHLPHQNVFQASDPEIHQSRESVTPRPVAPFYPEVTKCHTGSDKMSLLQVPESHTKYTKSNLDEIQQEKDSRSGSAAEELGVGRTTIRSHETTGTRNENQERRPGTTTNPKSKSVAAEGKGGAARAEEVKTTGRRKHGKGERPPALPIRVEVPLTSISRYFFDQAPQASQTSVAWSYAEMHKRGVDEYGFEPVMEQMKQLTIAMTPTIKARNPDGSIAQMRYFLTILEKKVDAWCNAYDKQVADNVVNEAQEEQKEQLAATSTPEPILAQEQNPHVVAATSISNPEPVSIAEPGSPVEQIAIQNPELVSPVEQNQQEVELVSPVEQIAEPEQIIDTKEYTHGWTETTATWWADRLRGYVGQDQYEYAIWPTRCPGHYGFVIRERRPGSPWEPFFTSSEANARIQQAIQAARR